jgi:type I restriction enzyme, S subunit
MKNKLISEGWEEVNFTQSIEKEIYGNKLKIKRDDYLEHGEYPIIDQGQKFISGYTDNKSKIYSGKLPVIIFGDHTRIFKFVDFSFALGADGTKILIPKSNIEPKYFYYFLNNLNIPSAGYSRHFKFLKEKKIIIPPLSVQKKIIGILQKIENTEKLSEESDKLTDNFLKSVFVEMFGYISSNSKKWPLHTLPYIVKNEKYSIQRGPFGGSLKKEIFKKEGYLVYEQFHAINDDFSMSRYFIDEEKFKELERFKVESGDLIVSCSGVTLGRIAEIPKNAHLGIINQALLKISLNPQIVNNTYFKFIFRSPEIQNTLFTVSRGTGIPNFPSLPEIKSILFSIPPIHLQNKFAIIVDKIEKIKANQNESKTQMQNLFNNIIQKSLKGELVC